MTNVGILLTLKTYLRNAIHQLKYYASYSPFSRMMLFTTSHLSMIHRVKERTESNLPSKHSAILLFVLSMGATADKLTGLGGGVGEEGWGWGESVGETEINCILLISSKLCELFLTSPLLSLPLCSVLHLSRPF